MLITDGHTGKTASVTNNNRLNVKSSTVKQAVIVSIEKEFTFIAEQFFATAGTTLDGLIQVLANLDPGRVIVIDAIDVEFSAAEAGGTVNLTRNPDIGPVADLTNNTEIDPINLNFGSGKQGLIQSIGHDGVGTGIGGVTGGVDFAFRATDVQTEFNFSSIDGLIVLQQGDELGIKVKHLTIAEVVSSSITYYLLDEGT